jgi:acetyl-CoA acetyltransferase
MAGLQRGSAAIVGVAESDLGAVAQEMTPIDLMAQGIHRALADCGLQLRDVDGVLCATTQSRTSGLSLSEYLGISPSFIDTTILGGSSFMFHVAHAQAALALGLCKTAVIAYGSTQRTVGRRQASVREYNPYETPFRPFLPATAYALAASRHMHQYGTTREQLAAVAVAAREWALLNPAAWEKEPLSIEQVLSARMISYPFTVRDCCLVTDGGGAVIMTTAERARSLKRPPVYVLGCGQAITHANISSMPDLTVTGALQSGRAAYEMARLAPRDIDVVELYDAFTINTILFLEDLGFCPKGEGGRFVEGGRIGPAVPGTARRAGRPGLPVNTNGGGLSYCHPGMYGLFLLIEATRQLRRECGARQVVDCDTAIAHGNGGVLSSQSTVILGTEATV